MDQITITVTVRTNLVGSKVSTSFKIDKEEWEGMSEKEKDELCKEHMFEMIEWNYGESD